MNLIDDDLHLPIQVQSAHYGTREVIIIKNHASVEAVMPKIVKK